MMATSNLEFSYSREALTVMGFLGIPSGRIPPSVWVYLQFEPHLKLIEDFSSFMTKRVFPLPAVVA